MLLLEAHPMCNTQANFISGVSLALILLAVIPAVTIAAEPSDAPAAPAALATVQGEFPGMSLELQSLQRSSGDVVTARFVLVNNSDKPLEFGYSFVEQSKNVPDFGSIGGTHLIDGAGKKKYLVLRDADDIPLCSRGLTEIAPQSSANLWAKFPAPPTDVQKVSIVVPHFNPIDDVTINP